MPAGWPPALRSERDEPGVRGVVVSADLREENQRLMADAGATGDLSDAGERAGGGERIFLAGDCGAVDVLLLVDDLIDWHVSCRPTAPRLLRRASLAGFVPSVAAAAAGASAAGVAPPLLQRSGVPTAALRSGVQAAPPLAPAFAPLRVEAVSRCQ